MSHIYQPIMMMALLKRDGECHERDIAKEIQEYDDAQIEYYIAITRNMVGKVLSKRYRHGIKIGNLLATLGLFVYVATGGFVRADFLNDQTKNFRFSRDNFSC
jgi:hypothetical protein